MSLEVYFINKTKKQILSTKKLRGYFEGSHQLTCYLEMCIGDTIIICYENELVEDIMYGSDKGNYKELNLFDYHINSHDNLYECPEFKRLYDDVKNNC